MVQNLCCFCPINGDKHITRKQSKTNGDQILSIMTQRQTCVASVPGFIPCACVVIYRLWPGDVGLCPLAHDDGVTNTPPVCGPGGAPEFLMYGLLAKEALYLGSRSPKGCGLPKCPTLSRTPAVGTAGGVQSRVQSTQGMQPLLTWLS